MLIFQIKFLYNKNNIKLDSEDILIDNFYDGDITTFRIKNKNNIKRSLYKYLSNITNKNLPYGALTGIRPVNILTQIIEYLIFNENTQSETLKIFIEYLKKNPFRFDNKNLNDLNLFKYLIKYLNDEYFVSFEKSELLYKIAIREIEILNSKKLIDYKNKISIYISVPSFNINKWSNYIYKYLISLDKELEKNINIKSQQIITLYIGGGTPTSFNNDDFKKFLEIIKKHINIDNLIEFTIEAGRPDTINEYKLKLMKEFNVTRISINPQTFNQKTLDLIGRKHSTIDIINKFKIAKDVGFDNINMDLILGLPNEKLEDVIYSLNEVINLNPESITTHMLSLKRASRLNYEKNIWKEEYLAGLSNDGVIEKMSNKSIEMIEKKYFLPYYLYRQKNIAGNLENIGFSKINFECLYNIFMMSERHSVYGFGCGASSKIVEYNNGEKIIKRIDGYKSIVDYTKEIS